MSAPTPVLDTVVLDQPTAARATWAAFRRNPLGVISAGLLALLVVVAIFAPLIATYPTGYSSAVLQPPSSAHWFGTDNLGRDIFAEVVWGSRISMVVATLASALAIVIGVVVAVAGAYFPRLDGAVGTVVDLCLSLPVLPLMILVAALAGPSLPTVILVIAFFSWPEVARVVRSQALSVVHLPYMDAARLTGGSHAWIIRKHLVPAVAPVIVVSVVLTASRAVLAAAGLAFLGLGDPESWSWGRILYESQQSGAMSSAWWTTLFPSLAILALVVSATLISIAYNDARNPRTRKD
jgi:peptide/nickel transport system permease protein